MNRSTYLYHRDSVDLPFLGIGELEELESGNKLHLLWQQ
jgi:hypothetical protein